MAQFVIKQTKTGFTFNLKANNKETIATSEVYNTKDSCKRGIKSVKRNAKSPVEDQTAKEVKKCRVPKYEIYKDKKGEFRFRLKAGNAQIIATGEGYKSLAACKNGIASIAKNAANAEVVDE